MEVMEPYPQNGIAENQLPPDSPSPTREDYPSFPLCSPAPPQYSSHLPSTSTPYHSNSHHSPSHLPKPHHSSSSPQHVNQTHHPNSPQHHSNAQTHHTNAQTHHPNTPQHHPNSQAHHSVAHQATSPPRYSSGPPSVDEADVHETIGMEELEELELLENARDKYTDDEYDDEGELIFLLYWQVLTRRLEMQAIVVRVRYYYWFSVEFSNSLIGFI